MKNKVKDENKKRKGKKTWQEADFEIHSLLDKDLYIRGNSDCVCCDSGPCSDVGS